jgi:hypothetical protein
MALTKNDIVARLQAELGLPKRKSIEITECLLEQIKASLESGLNQTACITWDLPRLCEISQMDCHP